MGEQLGISKDLYKWLEEVANTETEDEENKDILFHKAKHKGKEILSTCKHEDKFRFDEVAQLMHSVKEVDPKKLAVAYYSIMLYALNLLMYPWKKEFRTIKTYGGYFRVNIKAAMPEPWPIFKLLGYEMKDRNHLALIGHVNKEKVMDVAVCCLIASCECIIIAEVYETLNHDYSISNIWRCRQESVGDVEQCVEWIQFYCSRKMDEKTTSRGFKDTETGQLKGKGKKSKFNIQSDFTLDKNTEEEQYFSVHENHFGLPQVDTNVIVDDLYEPASLDQHLEYSLRALDNDEFKVKDGESTNKDQGGMNDWAVVYKTLEQDYGKEYFKGEREDVTEWVHQYPEITVPTRPVEVMLPRDVVVDGPENPTEEIPTMEARGVSLRLPADKVANSSTFSPDSGMVSQNAGEQQRKTTKTSTLPTQWNCGNCTYFNKAQSTICEVCSTSRDASKSPTKTLTSGGPECSKCTLVNEIGSVECAACANPLAGSPTYI